jgi:hypothetical protein
MEKDLKNITYFELPESFENNVMDRIRRIKKRRVRAKIIFLPAVLIAILSFTALFLMNSPLKKERTEGKPIASMEPLEQESHSDIYLEVIPVKSFEKENLYLIEFVNEKEERINAF